MENQSAPQKKLQRSMSQRMIAGVCGGLAEYFGVDPVIVRVVFALLFLIGSGGFWLYIVLWIVMPEGPASDIATPPASSGQ